MYNVMTYSMMNIISSITIINDISNMLISSERVPRARPIRGGPRSAGPRRGVVCILYVRILIYIYICLLIYVCIYIYIYYLYTHEYIYIQ